MEEKKALKKQFADILKGHLTAVLAEALLQLFVLGFLFVMDGVRIAGGVVFTVIYGALIYNNAKKAAINDKKSYSPLKPNLKKAVIFGVVIAGISVLLFAVHKGLWLWFGNGGELMNLPAKIINMIFVGWLIPYYGFMGTGAGVVTPIVAVLMIIVPIVFSVMGYFAGLKGINIFNRLTASIYEKK